MSQRSTVTIRHVTVKHRNMPSGFKPTNSFILADVTKIGNSAEIEILFNIMQGVSQCAAHICISFIIADV